MTDAHRRRLEEVAPVRALLATYEELWALVNALTAVNLALLHSAPPGGRTLKRRAAPHRPSGPAGPLGFTISAEMTAALHAVCAAVPPCPPPADFGATAAWYRLSLLTDNVLSALKSLALPPT